MVVKAISIIFGVIFIALGYWLLKDLSTSHISIITTIFQGWTGYFITYIGIHMIFSKILEKNKIISFIYYRILVLPVVGLMYFRHISAPLLTLIIFLGIYFLPSMLFLALVNIYPSLGKYSQGIVYILSLLSVFFFAYKSNVLMKFAIKMFKTRLFKHYLYSITSIQLTRMYTYIIMVVVYILYNFFNLSNINLPFIPFETLNVIKEVFITFVAIDSLIQTSKYIKKEN